VHWSKSRADVQVCPLLRVSACTDRRYSNASNAPAAFCTTWPAPKYVKMKPDGDEEEMRSRAAIHRRKMSVQIPSQADLFALRGAGAPPPLHTAGQPQVLHGGRKKSVGAAADAKEKGPKPRVGHKKKPSTLSSRDSAASMTGYSVPRPAFDNVPSPTLIGRGYSREALTQDMSAAGYSVGAQVRNFNHLLGETAHASPLTASHRRSQFQAQRR
jgi:hypothetical protein